MGCDSSVDAGNLKKNKLTLSYFDGFGRAEPARMMVSPIA